MKLAQRIKISFARSAANYGRHASLQRDVSEYLIRSFAPDARAGAILDIGCGTGFTSLEAARRWPRASVISLDVALPMAREARRNGIGRAVAADAADLPFKDHAFDAVISSLAFQWLVSPRTGPRFFGAVKNMLKSGGLLAFSVVADGTLKELRTAYDEACRECTGEKAGFSPLPDGAAIARLMREAGFAGLRREHRTMERMYTSVDELFGILKGIGAAAPGRPTNPPRRDILNKTRAAYPTCGNLIRATYEVDYFSAVKP